MFRRWLIDADTLDVAAYQGIIEEREANLQRLAEERRGGRPANHWSAKSDWRGWGGPNSGGPTARRYDGGILWPDVDLYNELLPEMMEFLRNLRGG